MSWRSRQRSTDESAAARADEALDALRPRAPDLGAYVRVREALRAAPSPRPPRPRWKRWRFWGLSTFVAVLVVALWWTGRDGSQPARPAVVAAPAASSATRHDEAAIPVTPSPAAPPPSVAPNAPGSSGPPDRGAQRKRPPHRPAPTVVARPVPQPPPPATADGHVEHGDSDPARRVRNSPDKIEAELLTGAINALRRDGDAARAAMLLGFYRDRYPQGSMMEEALILSVEAAEAQHDGRARAFARRYLEEYPAGRYRQAATRAADASE